MIYRLKLSLPLFLLFISSHAQATYCENGQCYNGIDGSGRGPQGMKDSAQEILDHPQGYTHETLSMARKALKDADNPSMYDPIAVECNKPGIVKNFVECVRDGHIKNGFQEQPKFRGQLHYTIRETIMWRSPDGPTQAMRDYSVGKSRDEIRARWISCVMPEGSEFISDFGDPSYMMFRGGENEGLCAGKYGWVSFQDVP